MNNPVRSYAAEFTTFSVSFVMRELQSEKRQSQFAEKPLIV